MLLTNLDIRAWQAREGFSLSFWLQSGTIWVSRVDIYLTSDPRNFNSWEESPVSHFCFILNVITKLNLESKSLFALSYQSSYHLTFYSIFWFYFDLEHSWETKTWLLVHFKLSAKVEEILKKNPRLKSHSTFRFVSAKIINLTVKHGSNEGGDWFCDVITGWVIVQS